MADPIEISALPAATALTGTELVPVVQGGVTSQSTADAVSTLVQGDIPDVEADALSDITVDTSDPDVVVIGRTPAAYEVFDASGTWTKPTNATLVQVICIGGGSGGGGGVKGAAGVGRNGGGGGQAGFTSEGWFAATDLGATVAVTVGPGGAGGAAVTANTTNGTASTAGTATTFGTHLSASGGPAVPGGSLSGTGAGDTGTTASNRRGSFRNNPGGTCSTVATAPPTSLGGHVGSGGAGGGIDAGDTPRAGGAAGSGVGNTGGTGGAVGVVGVAGNAGTGACGGGGGGGGGAASGATAGAGGAGGVPGGGGGGGGAGVNSVADSGAGGAGATGRCVVISYF